MIFLCEHLDAFNCMRAPLTAITYCSNVEKNTHSDDIEKKIDSSEASKDFYPVLVDLSEESSLRRGLKARQISMITPHVRRLASTGLIIGLSTALVRGGPLGLWFGYSSMDLVCYFVKKMGAFLPNKKGLTGYATRYVNAAFGFVLGWNHVFKFFTQTTKNVEV